MATAQQLKDTIDQFVDITAPKAYQIVNGGDTETVTTDAGVIPTFAKAIFDFQNDGTGAINTFNTNSADSIANFEMAISGFGYYFQSAGTVTTLADGNVISLNDGANKKITWLNFKTQLQTWLNAVTSIAGAKVFGGLVSGTSQTLANDNNFVTTLLMRQETQEVSKFLSSTPLVDWTMGNWGGSGVLPSKGLNANDLTLAGTPTITQSNNGRQLNFNGSTQSANGVSDVATWQRINDGKPFVLLIEGDSICDFKDYGCIMATSSFFGQANKGFVLNTFSDILMVEMHNPAGTNFSIQFTGMTGKTVTGIVLAYNGTKFELLAKTNTNLFYTSSTNSFATASGTPSAEGSTNTLRIAKYASAIGNFAQLKLSRIRLFDRYIDPKKLLS